MYTTTIDLDFDKESDIKQLVKALRQISPVLEEEKDTYLIQKIQEYLFKAGGYVDLRDISIQLTVSYLDKKFRCGENQEEFKVIYEHKSNRILYQKRIFSVWQEIKTNFPNIDISIRDSKIEDNYILLVKNKRIFKSQKFQTFCKSVKEQYEENYGEANYTVELKGED